MLSKYQYQLKKGIFMKRLLIKLLALVLISIFPLSFFSFFEGAAYAENSNTTETIRVGWYEMNGLQNTVSPGKYSGYNYEYLQAVSQYTRWKYQFISGTYEECKKMLEKGEIDIMGGMRKTDDLVSKFEFADLSSGMGGEQLITRGDNTSLYYNHIQSYDHITIGTLSNKSFNQNFLEYCQRNECNIHLVYYSSFEKILAALNRKEVDAALMSRQYNVSQYRILNQFVNEPFYFVAKKGNNKLIREMDSAISQIKLVNPDFDSSLYYKWLYAKNHNVPSYTQEEQDYIKKNPNLTIIYDANWYPLEYKNQKTGKYEGIVADYLRLLSQKTGFKFHYVTQKYFDQSKKKIENNSAQIMSAVVNDYNWAQKNSIYITQPFFNVQMELVFASNGKTNRHIIAIPKGYYSAFYLENYTNGEYQIQYYNTPTECMEALRKGKVDYTLLNSYESDYYLSIPKYKNCHSISQVGENRSLSVGVSKQTDPIVFSIISKAMSTISEENINDIVRNAADKTYFYSFNTMIYSHPLEMMLIALALIGVLVWLILMVYYNKESHRKNKELELINQAKTEFLSCMSHEIRTPLTTIIGINRELYSKPQDANFVKECSQKISTSSDHLLELINDMLDISKINEGKFTITMRPFNFNEMIKTIQTVYQIVAEQRQVHFEIFIDPNLYPYMIGDELRLKQIMINLISNAIKYNKANGNVTIQAESLYQTKDRQTIRISVSDTGIGIAPENIHKIFDEFEREERPTNRYSSGTGLGLAISSKIAELMNSQIHVKSEINVGSTFWFELQLEKTEAMDKISYLNVSSTSFNHAKILVAEDHAVNAKIMEKLLKSFDFDVTLTYNGKECIEEFQKSSENYYAAILMDVRMPYMNGIEATERIRHMERRDAQTIPIIAMTANAFDEDRDDTKRAGMNAHLAKPIVPDILLETLSEFIIK